jgi:hypothetical protein
MIWLFFTVILKPKQGSLIPNLETQRNTAATNHLLTQVTFVFSWRLILFFLETAIIRGEITNDLTTQVLISLAMLVILWSIFRLYRWWRRRVRQQQETETPSNYAFAAKSDECQARAKRKISRRLTEAEQRELEQLAFEAEASNRTTFRLPITIVWILITMLIAQTVQEIFRRF